MLATLTVTPARRRAADVPQRTMRVYILALATILFATIAASSVLHRALDAARGSATADDALQAERLLTARVAGLSAQYALGDAAVRPDLKSGIERIAALDAARPGPESLRTALRDFVGHGRAMAATPAGDSRRIRQLAPIIAAAGRSLPDRFDRAISAQRRGVRADLNDIAGWGLVCALATIGAVFAQAFAVVAPLRRRCAELIDRVAQLQRTATIDPLTGTLNSDSFQARGAVEIAKARRHHRPLSLLLIDPDDLPQMRKQHGADAGDRLLRAVGETVCGGTRTTDLIGRAASGEFAVLLPDTDPAGARLLAERLRERIRTLSVPLATSVVSCTVSIGVAAAERDASFFAPILARAGEALYEAQVRGRNRVFVNAA